MSASDFRLEDQYADSPVMRQAERWFARLDGQDCTPGERRQFERWLEEPEHAQAYAAVEEAWAAAGQLHGDPAIDRLIGQAYHRARRERRVFRHPWLTALAATVLLTVLAGVAVLATRHYFGAQVYTTAFGQRSTVQLEDGSQVILNSATRLQVRFSGERRQFTLKSGEALFTVAQDPDRPFTVNAGDGEVRALGTRFQLRNEQGRVAVTLLEGRIALDRNATGQLLQLRPGEQVRFVVGDAYLERRNVDPDIVSSWTSGRLRFKDAPLQEVLQEVNRYSKVQIQLADPSLASRPINATLDMGDSSAVMGALELLLPVEAVTAGRNRILLVRRRD